MSEEKEKKLQQFWDKEYQNMEFYIAKKEDFRIENILDENLKFIGDHCQTVLDFGCGVGYTLEEVFALGSKAEKGIGVDPSENVIDYNNRVNECFRDKVKFTVGDERFLTEIPSESIDGIICSNVLDVISLSQKDYILKEFYRILRKGGYLLMKINFYLTEKQLENPDFEIKEGNEIYLDGILRVVNRNTEAWLDDLKSYTLIREGGFERIKDGPQDRLFLFRKPN